MRNRRWLRIIIGVLLISANVGCDQFTKSMVRKAVLPNEQIAVITNHLTVTKVENTGAFMSMGQSWWPPVKIVLLIVLPILALGFAFHMMIKRSGPSLWFTWGLAFAIGGGTGNLIDRIIHGSVTDFLHLRAGIFQTGIFNMADVSIMVGIGMVLVDVFVFKNGRQPNTDTFSRI